MSKPQNIAFEICRSFVDENKQYLSLTLQNLIYGALRGRNIRVLAELSSSVSPEHTDIRTFSVIRQISALFKKNSDFVDDRKCNQAAQDAFYDAEETCALTNVRIGRMYADEMNLGLESLEYGKEIALMRDYISRVLGDFPTFFESIPFRVRLTSGATASSSRSKSQPYRKIKYKISCTPAVRPYVETMYKCLGFAKPKFNLVVANRVEFVPKNWKTHRTIAMEPEGNLPFQLSFDSWCKERLRSHGIDLRNQSLNQDLARQGSMDGSLATVDLSAASDTVSLNTVAFLLPEDWFQFLTDIRTPGYRIGREGELRQYHKFSSMGNGTTFALETLIFASACYAVGSKSFTAYGDDIIIETGLYSRLVQVLELFGFSTNEDKSFHAGPFRESCGYDTWEGVNITPFYLRGTPSNQAGWCHLVNGLMSIGGPDGPLWLSAKKLVRERKLPLVPCNPDSMTGVWIDAQTARRMRMLKEWKAENNQQTWISRFRGYVAVGTDTQSISTDRRGLILWYVDRLSADASCRLLSFDDKTQSDLKTDHLGAPLVRSKVQRRTSYKRKWLAYHPVGRAPAGLYAWSVFISG